MKILKIFGIVVGIHVFALILIFANPGCSSTSKPPPPVPTDTVSRAEPPITVPTTSSNYVSGASSGPSPFTPAPSFNPDAPATAGPVTSGLGAVRTTPTRPGTPVAGVLVAEPVVDVTPATTYVVKTGDNLWTVAKKNHLTAPELAAANNLDIKTVIKPGQKLLIPGKSTSPAAAATAKGAAGATPKAAEVAGGASAAKGRPTDGAFKHVVASGETLGSIAKKYDVKQNDIAVANSIADPAKIKAGTELIIPGWQQTGTKTGKNGKSGTKKGADQKGTPPVEAPTLATPPPVPVINLGDSPVSPVTPAPTKP